MYGLLSTIVIILIIYVLLESLLTSVTDVRTIIMFNGEKLQRRYRKMKEMANRQEK